MYFGMNEETEKFYKEFCKKTQSKNGMWEQRFYTDGRLAPCWGYQIDETASVIFGVYDHFRKVKDKNFLKDTLRMCENATTFLEKYIEDILENKNKFQKSYDLWEEYEGVSLYSISAVFGAFTSMLKIYEEVKDSFENNRLKIEAINKNVKKIEKLLIDIKEYCLKTFYDDNKKAYIRNVDDRKIDISLIGTVTPFNMFTPKEKNIQNTIERINMTLRTYTGGYLRFENDHYTGDRPWVIATLWMALYYIEIGNIKEARECFDYVVKTQNPHGFLAEQVDNQKMEPAWIIGLGWSHAMFILVLNKLKQLEK